MLNQKVLEYVDDVMRKIDAPEDLKIKLGNELTRHFIEASEHASIDDIIYKLGSSERLANEMSNKLINEMSKELKSIFTESDKQNVKLTKESEKNYKDYKNMRKHDRCMPKKYGGEFTREESDVNIKLLYIPLIQISSGVQKLHYFLRDDECYIN